MADMGNEKSREELRALFDFDKSMDTPALSPRVVSIADVFMDQVMSIYAVKQVGRVLLNAIASNGKRWRIHFERGKYEIRDLELYWDPNYVVTEPTYQKVMEAGAAYVYLFHELLHFHRIQLGIYKSVYTGSQDPREEYPVTGLYETKNDAFPKVETNEPGIDSINENAFRRELRLPRRPCYFFTMTNPDLYRAEAFVRSGFLQSNGKFLDPQGYLTYNSEECRFPYIYRRARGAFRTEPQGARLASRGSTSRFRGPSAVG